MIRIRILAVQVFLLFAVTSSFSQHSSKDLYKGDWESPSSWDPVWLTPVRDSIDVDITINGYITTAGSVSFAYVPTTLIINDTLIINGDLFLGNKNNLTINDAGILIIKGNLIISNKTCITSNKYLIVAGDIIKEGSQLQGSATSNDNPAQIFVLGTVSPIISDNVLYPVFDTEPPLLSLPYPSSGDSFGNMTDLSNDPVFAFYSATCKVKSATANGPLCPGQTIMLHAEGGTSYEWTGPGGFTSNLQDPSITDINLLHAGTYSVSITELFCPVEIKTSEVVINAAPAAGITCPDDVCEGDAISLGSSGGVTSYWTGPNGFESTSRNPVIPSATSVMSGTYSVKVTSAENCSSTVTHNLTVNVLPSATLSTNSPLCTGNTLTLTSGGGTQYSWTGPSGFTSSAQNPVIEKILKSNAGDYTVVVTDDNNCRSEVSATVIVNEFPLPLLSSNSPVCSGEKLTLTCSGGTSFNWSGPSGFSSSVQNPVIENTLPLHSGTYIVVVTDANNCSSEASVPVVINELPVPVASSNTPLCSGEKILLTSSGGTSFSWSGPSGFTSSQQNPFIEKGLQSHSGNYVVAITDANNCSSEASVQVVVNELPVPVAYSNSPVCQGDAVLLSSSGGTTFFWTGPSGFSANIANPSIPDADLSKSGTFEVTVTGENNCSSKTTVQVVVSPLPDVKLNMPGNHICTGDNLALTGIPDGGIYNLKTGPGGIVGKFYSSMIPGQAVLEYSYTDGCRNMVTQSVNVVERPVAIPGDDQLLKYVFETSLNADLPAGLQGSWSLLSGSGIIGNANSPVTLVKQLAVGENIFRWTVSNNYCEESREVKIIVEDLFLPSVITPNNDGKNDFFVTNIQGEGIKLTVFNRWGKIVFKSTDYKNDWDGKNSEGEDIPEDTYYYIIEIGSGISRKGSLTIIR